MKLATDSSALAKRYIEEPGSDKLVDLLAPADELGVCVILLPEIVSALNRRIRENVITHKEYRRIRGQLLDDIRDATILQITSPVVVGSITLLETNTLRAMDALHIACALEWRADLFVTSDKRQFAAAKQAGLSSVFLGG
ncbi:MAG: type II toxin-antitoxin system VapC family toxin [Chloroflexi bacterium]|nr:type II toxin-antitoxin system VapC family toxin [Chloroflexota bacterium]